MIERRPRFRRRGEANGPVTWQSIISGAVDILLILALLVVIAAEGSHLWKNKDKDAGLRDVPASEYKIKGKMK